MAAEQIGSDGLDPLGLSGVVSVGDVVIAAGEHLGGVDPSGDGLSRAVHTAGVGDRDDGPQQRLAGDTGPVGALASDEFTLRDGY
jgi:hypothetical protein